MSSFLQNRWNQQIRSDSHVHRIHPALKVTFWKIHFIPNLLTFLYKLIYTYGCHELMNHQTSLSLLMWAWRALEAVALATALSHASEWPIQLGSVFVCLEAALLAAGLQKNRLQLSFYQLQAPPPLISCSIFPSVLLFVDLFPGAFLTMVDGGCGFHHNRYWWMFPYQKI